MKRIEELKREAEKMLRILGKSQDEIEAVLERLNDEEILRSFIEKQQVLAKLRNGENIKVKKPDIGIKPIGETMMKELGANTKEEAVQKFLSKFKVVDNEEWKEIDEELRKKEEEELKSQEQHQRSRWTILNSNEDVDEDENVESVDEDVEDRITALENRVEKLEKRVDEIERRLDTLEKKVDAIASKLDEIASKLDSLMSKLNELERNVDELIHPHSSTLIHTHPQSSTFIHSHPHSSTFIHNHPQKNVDENVENVDEKSSTITSTVENVEKCGWSVDDLKAIDGKSLRELGWKSWFWKKNKNALLSSGIVQIVKDGRRRVVKVVWMNVDVNVENVENSRSNVENNRSNVDECGECGCNVDECGEPQTPKTDEGKQNVDANVENVENVENARSSETNLVSLDSSETIDNNKDSLKDKKESLDLKTKRELESKKESKEHGLNTDLKDKKESLDLGLKDSLDLKLVHLEKGEKNEEKEDELSFDELSSIEADLAVASNRKVKWVELVKGRYFYSGEEYKLPEKLIKIVRFINDIANSKKRNKTELIRDKVEQEYLDLLIKFEYLHPDTLLPLDYEIRKEIVFKKLVDDDIYETAKEKWKTIKKEQIAGLVKIAQRKKIDKEKLKSWIAMTRKDYIQFKTMLEELDTKFLPEIIPVYITDEPFESYLLKGNAAPDRRMRAGETYDEYVERILKGEEAYRQLEKLKNVEQQAPVEWIRKLKTLRAVDFRSVKDYLFDNIAGARKHKRLIVFAGKPGTGKTFAALQLALLLSKTNLDFLGFYEFPDMHWKELRDIISQPKGILVIDDLGYGGRRNIDWIIHKIHARRKDPTIITMNLEPIDILFEYGGATMRRMQESAVWFDVRGLQKDDSNSLF